MLRYMVMLRVGGVYADVDTECRQPMDAVLRANDSMVVGWENEFDSPAEAEHRHYVRSRQVSQRPIMEHTCCDHQPLLREPIGGPSMMTVCQVVD